MFDTEQFIFAIRERPGLYDMTSKDYLNRDLKAQLWTEVAAHVLADWDDTESEKKYELVKDLKKKWKNIKDSYMKDVKAESNAASGQPTTKKRPYVYYELLSFLRPQMNNSNNSHHERFCSTNNQSPSSSIIADQDSEHQRTEIRPLIRRNKVLKRKLSNNDNLILPQITQILSERLQLQRKKNEEDANGNKAFLMSYVPILNAMTPHLAMEARFQICNLFRNLQRSATDHQIHSDHPTSEGASNSSNSSGA